MRIAFVWDWPSEFSQTMTWHDGLAAAVKILSERHELQFFTMGKRDETLIHDYFPINVRTADTLLYDVGKFKPDVILMWGDCTRPNAKPLADLGIPMALCFAGGDTNGPTQVYFDHFFVESAEYLERFEASGCSVSTAFGTNTELFKPIDGMQKHFDTIFPATFCEWKRHRLYREAVQGLRNVCAGFMYPDHERDCWEDTMKAGVLTLPHVSAETLRFLYAASKVCVVTSKGTGGSQRTVLEAMSMNIPVVVTEDCKGYEYVHDAANFSHVGWDVPPEPQRIRGTVDDIIKFQETAVFYKCHGRDYILSKWTETHYADALENGMLALLKK